MNKSDLSWDSEFRRENCDRVKPVIGCAKEIEQLASKFGIHFVRLTEGFYDTALDEASTV